jgi:phosphoglycerate dehydrogenase-like enzyme
MPDHLNVVSSYVFTPESEARLKAAINGGFATIRDRKDWPAMLHDADVYFGMRIPDNWREVAPRLRWIQYPAAGIDRLRNHPILQPDSGVLFTTARGTHVHQIGEYVLCSMLMFNRSWPHMLQLQQQHKWPDRETGQTLRERELFGRTLGVVGFGHIGRQVAQLARAFGMRILATSSSTPEHAQDPEADQLYPLARLHDLLHESDYVVISVPLTNKTEKMIGEAELRAMRPQAYLVNIARGQVIDEKALIRALRENWIAGAGLDVYSQEPLPATSPLYELPNVIMTPHLAGGSEHVEERLLELFIENLQHFRAGQPLRNQYNPAKGY